VIDTWTGLVKITAVRMGALLTIKQAAERLNVHTATVRRWADNGDIPSVRTPGGHRRFPAEAVERLVSGRSPVASVGGEEATTQHVIHVSSQDLTGHHNEPWMARMSENAKEESRLLGKRLMGLLMQFMAADNGEGEEVLEEGRVIGRIYAKSIIVNGISLQQALKATLFFKDHILESAVMLPDVARQNPEANKRVFRRINEFLNAIQLVIAETYERVSESS